MKQNSILGSVLGNLQAKGQPGRLPVVTPCPYCGAHLNQTAHRGHRAACEAAFRLAPPQAPADFMHDAGGGYRLNGVFPQT